MNKNKLLIESHNMYAVIQLSVNSGVSGEGWIRDTRQSSQVEFSCHRKR